MRTLACAVLLLAVTAAPCAAYDGVAMQRCADQSSNDDFVVNGDDVTVGPLTLLGLRRLEDYTEDTLEQTHRSWKGLLLLRPGHRATIRIAPRSRDVARLTWTNDAYGPPEFAASPHTVRFRACSRKRAASIADGRPTTFWSGGMVFNAFPGCVHLTVRIDRREPRRLRVPVGQGACARS